MMMFRILAFAFLSSWTVPILGRELGMSMRRGRSGGDMQYKLSAGSPVFSGFDADGGLEDAYFQDVLSMPIHPPVRFKPPETEKKRMKMGKKGMKMGKKHLDYYSSKDYHKGKGKHKSGKGGMGKGKGYAPIAVPPPVSMVVSMPTMMPIMEEESSPAPSIEAVDESSEEESGAMPDDARIADLPSNEPGESVDLALFQIVYEFEAGFDATPDENDQQELVQSTNDYIHEFLGNEFRSSSVFMHDQTQTLGTPLSPTMLNYLTTVSFLQNSEIPPENQLMDAIAAAFSNEGIQNYLKYLEGTLTTPNVYLNVNNIIYNELTTQEVRMPPIPTTEDDSEETKKPASSPTPAPSRVVVETQITNSADDDGPSTPFITAGAGAGVFAILVAGLLLRRRGGIDEDAVGKFLEADGQITVAGETFTGDTYNGGSSLDSQSQINRTATKEQETSAADWTEMHRLHRGDTASTVSQEEMEMQEALSAGRAPSPTYFMHNSVLEECDEEDEDDDDDYEDDEDDEHHQRDEQADADDEFDEGDSSDDEPGQLHEITL